MLVIVGGTTTGILFLGPRYLPRYLPILGINGASAMKKSYFLANFLACLGLLAISSSSALLITSSPSLLAASATAPSAMTAIFTSFPLPWGSTTSSLNLFSGRLRSISLRFTATSTLCVKLRGLARALASFTASTIFCLSKAILDIPP
ncbi:147aa long hypothetical protein [Pyrococcus horikoshii OT3]|uniref:Uncharacterized protein PH2001 n=1 Tax=Pyrococcus horikoshii (strain ATCC 700860 / DSM 12428 / JCM 9974 / NBRC 100139 / OT-3) TaxID=70601 RepID=Y2001_PYRHO|nr:RecName: Full=Uncharacterized protein PH2001 [Pyrococcus horikoshii OT3]BAA31943.1 147aa long hypothetical protein [Pyrococcus horikoshii OT3]